MSRNLLYGLIIGYCIVSSGNGMVSTFYHHEFLQFFDKTCNFFSNFLIFLIQVFPDPGAREHPKGFYNKLLTNFQRSRNSFSTF